ncbi:glycosyltransferase family 2 protein [Leuconostoc holzapfelii]|uniref:Glycosyltransferase n=1 Tax=Leuconostoc holzapfelii TaxID=434464 RepID=A0A846ZA71_9LACO|nr:glycosyltransferase family 2 protein [Leuconostoc holzapfelii]NKZ18316.1 glycosyltransferase [Leuconostoc holzapfelii]
MSEPKVSAVIVTYNRLPLLKEAIQNVLAQDTTALQHLIVVNGASTDGTQDYLATINDPRVIVENLAQNLGGAGGFNWGIRQFIEKTSDDYVWLMDDDSMPTPTALTKLLDLFASHPAGWAASKVVWTDGNWSKMNVPAPIQGTAKTLLHDQTQWLPIKQATFVSTIFSREVIAQIGLPQKEYFIWGDDIEFTQRATQVSDGYFVRDSIVVHASQANPKPGDIVGELDEARLPRYHFEYRNRILTSRRRHAVLKLLKTFVHTGLDFLKTLVLPGVHFRGRKLKIILQGTYQGVRFQPAIEYVTSPGEDAKIND